MLFGKEKGIGDNAPRLENKRRARGARCGQRGEEDAKREK